MKLHEVKQAPVWEEDVAKKLAELVALFNYKLRDFKPRRPGLDRHLYYGTIIESIKDDGHLFDKEKRLPMLRKALAKLLIELAQEGREVAAMRVTRYSMGMHSGNPDADTVAPIFIRPDDTIARLAELLESSLYWSAWHSPGSSREAFLRVEVGEKPKTQQPEPAKPKVLRVVKKSAQP